MVNSTLVRALLVAFLVAFACSGSASVVMSSGPRYFGSTGGGGGGSDPFTIAAPNATTDMWVDLDSVTNGTGTQASPYQKSQLTLAKYQTLICSQQLVFVNASGTGTYTPINLTSGLASCSESTRITVRTYPGQTKARWNFPTDGRSYQLSYWDFRDLDFRTDGCGFRMGDNSWGGDNGGGGNVDGNADHIRLIDIDGTRTAGGVLDATTTDNRGIITARYGGSARAQFIGIYRGHFTGPSGESNNQSLIWFDYMRDFEIIGNLFDNGAAPVYFKHTDQLTDVGDGVIANNIFRNSGIGVRASINWAVWSNNAFESAALALDEDGGSVAFSGSNNTLTHNTFYNSDWLAPFTSMRSSNNTATNNVMAGSSRYADSPFAALNNGNSVNYSAVAGTGTTHYQRASSNYTMAAYKVAFPTNEVNGVAGTITLVGGTSPGATPANWAIASGVGIGDASDGADRGVNSALLLTATGAAYHAFNFNLDDARLRYAANDDQFKVRAHR